MSPSSPPFSSPRTQNLSSGFGRATYGPAPTQTHPSSGFWDASQTKPKGIFFQRYPFPSSAKDNIFFYSLRSTCWSCCRLFLSFPHGMHWQILSSIPSKFNQGHLSASQLLPPCLHHHHFLRDHCLPPWQPHPVPTWLPSSTRLLSGASHFSPRTTQVLTMAHGATSLTHLQAFSSSFAMHQPHFSC